MSDLDIGSHIMLLLLQRAHDGHVTGSGGFYFDDGRYIWHSVTLAFRTLVEVGRLQLGEPGTDRMQPVSLTEKGLTEFKALCERQQAGG